FLGICHSLAHKLGAAFHLPHGIANALLITEVMRYNAAEVPTKMGTFPQYGHPRALRRYAEIAESLNLPGRTEEEKLESLIAKSRNCKRSSASGTRSATTESMSRDSWRRWTAGPNRPSTTNAPAPIRGIRSSAK